MKVGFDWPVGVFSAAIGPLKPGSARLQVARERDGVDLGGLVRELVMRILVIPGLVPGDQPRPLRR